MGSPAERLRAEAARRNVPPASDAFAAAMDAADPLAHLRAEFAIPPRRAHAAASPSPAAPPPPARDLVYLCGNSLGLLPRESRRLVEEEFDVWAGRGVDGHFDHPHARPWVTVDEEVVAKSARIVGARPLEVAIMNSLTVNLHLLMISFYTPTKERYKILVEDKAFPSDRYAIQSQIELHGYDPKEAFVSVGPRPGGHVIEEDDIVSFLRAHGDSIALVLIGGVHYYSGQAFDMERITAAAHEMGCVVGFDLAHAVGNIELKLHDWDVDFACWCTYKYLNSGPGGIAGAFVHERHSGGRRPRLAGWWGHDKTTRFDMGADFSALPGAAGYQLSNPSVLATTSLLGSLNVFERTSMADLRAKSLLLTGYLELLIDEWTSPEDCVIITPREPSRRGCQISLKFLRRPVEPVFDALTAKGVVCDVRTPDVIRISPAPLYNRFADVFAFAVALRDVLAEM
ncbi:pyridoxal phosphate-dependent transferase [Hyaloraphidium curvatum]|nr:pyridoxal phosphate-dependent transferase [Hyaloraphidium curvatum]